MGPIGLGLRWGVRVRGWRRPRRVQDMRRVLLVWSTIAKHRPGLRARSRPWRWGERHRIRQCVGATLPGVRRKGNQKGKPLAGLPSLPQVVVARRTSARKKGVRRLFGHFLSEKGPDMFLTRMALT